MTTDDERREAGMRTRREVLGDAHVDRAVAATTPFTADFQDFITRTAWGDLWQRPGLSRRASPGRCQRSPQAVRVMKSWKSAVNGVVPATARSTWASPSTSRRVRIPASRRSSSVVGSVMPRLSLGRSGRGWLR